MVLVIEVNNMSEINIYINDEDKVSVKDDTQIIKMKGDRGQALRYEDLTEAQKAELKGPKGDRGNDGKNATAETAYHTLLRGNVWCKDSTVDNVLVSMIGNLNKPFPRTEFIPLSVGIANKGQTVVSVTGEPHYSVKVLGNDVDVFPITENGNGSVTIQPLGEDDVKLTYHNYMGEQVGETTINGIIELKADEEYADETGAKFIRYGKKLVMKLNNYNNNSFNWLGKWNKQDIETVEIINETQKTIFDSDYATKKYDGLTFIIKKPSLLNFETRADQGTVSITTDERSVKVTLNGHLEWNGGTYESEHL